MDPGVDKAAEGGDDMAVSSVSQESQASFVEFLP